MKKTLKFIASLIVVAVPLSVVAAAPTVAPPNGNPVLNFLDTTATAQSKIGGLLLNSGGAANGLIVQSGNVGIGTTNPYTSLNVQRTNDIPFSGTGYRIATFNSPTATVADQPGVTFGYDTAGAGIIAAATQSLGQPLAFWTYNGSTWGERMRIDKAGNVGIGTTAPLNNALLTVNGSLSVVNASTLSSDIWLSNDGYKYITNHPSSGDYLAIAQNPFASGIQLGFSQSGTPTAFNPKMTILPAGNVGIGTTTPTSKLQVYGDSSRSLFFQGTTVSNPNPIIAARVGTSPAYLGFAVRSNLDPAALTDAAAADVRMVLDLNGNVGIGTTAPGQKLSVAGTIESTTGGFKFPDGTVQTTAGGGSAPTLNIVTTAGNTTTNTITTAGLTATGPVVAATSAGTSMVTGRQVGGSYSYPDGIFKAITDNPNGALNNYFQGVTGGPTGTTNFLVRADGQGYFAGNVGIGTTNPGAALDVAGPQTNFDTSAYGQVKIKNNSTAYNSGPRSGIAFSVQYAPGTYTAGGTTIQNYKDNTTSGDFANGLLFTTQANGSAPSEKMRITSGGNVGIGTTNPGSRLEVTSAESIPFRITNPISPDSERADFGFLSNSTSNNALRIGTLALSGGITLQGTAQSASVTKVPIIFNPDGGNVGIGTTAPGNKLTVAGDVGATAYYYTSDRRLKKNITNLDDSLSKVLKLQGVSFDWKKDGTHSVGLIAQDVEKVYPELVRTDKTTGLKSVEYGNLVAPLIEAIKTQQKEIDSLKAEVETLRNK